MKNVTTYPFGIVLMASMLMTNMAFVYDSQYDAIPAEGNLSSHQPSLVSVDEISPFCEDYRLILSEKDESISTVAYSADRSSEEWIDYLGEDYSLILNED